MLQGGDGTAEQEQDARHVAPGCLEAALVAAAGLGEQRSHVFAEHGQGRVRKPGLEVGHPGYQQSGPTQGFDVGEVLGGHDAALLHQAREPGRVDPRGPFPGDADGAHPVQPVEQRHHVARRGRFRGVPQPGEPGAPDGRVGYEQAVERRLLSLGDAVSQGLERALARPRPGGEADPFQHRGVRHQHTAAMEVGQHGLHDRLAAVGGAGGTGTHPQAIAPVAQPEAAQAEENLELDGMLAAGLVAPGIVGERGGRDAELGGHEPQHGRGRVLAGTESLSRVTQQAELDGEAQAVEGAALGTHQQKVLGAEHVVPGHLGRRGRDGEQAGALLGGQQGTAGHRTSGRVRPRS